MTAQQGGRLSKPKTRAAVYTRVSQDRESTEHGVERQRADCRNLAARLGWQVVADFSDNDTGASTRSRKARPEYADMIARARRGEFDAIVAYSNSRLTRRLLEFEDLIQLAERHGVRISTVVSGEDDLATADGRMTARIKASVDAAEAERIGERTKRQKQAAAVKGEFRGGRRPFGYEADGTLNEPEAAVVLDCSRAVIAGRPLGALARELNEQGRPSTGTAWDRVKLRNVLVRPRNAALVSSGRSASLDCEIIGPAQWEPIVDRETLDAVRAVLLDPARRTNSSNLDTRWLLSGIARCGICGEALRAAPYQRWVGGVDVRRYLYRCVATPHLGIDAPRTDTFVSATLRTLVSDPDIRAAMHPEQDAALEADRARRVTLEHRLDTLADEHADGLLTARQVKRATDRITLELDEIEQRLTTATTRHASAAVLDASDPAFALRTAPIDLQRSVLRTVASVVVLPAQGRGRPFDTGRIKINSVADGMAAAGASARPTG